MKIKAILFLVGIMCFVTVLYFATRALIKSITCNRSQKQKKRKKTDRKKSKKCDWIEKRRQAEWSDRYKSQAEMDLSEITAGYVQTMILLLFLLLFLIIVL